MTTVTCRKCGERWEIYNNRSPVDSLAMHTCNVPSFRDKLHCFFGWHKPDKTHGYYDEPARGAQCVYCGKPLA